MTTNRKWRAGLAAAITAVAVGGWGTTAWGASAGTSPHAQSTPAAVTPQPCGTATGPFHVSGDQVLNANGDPFVSYGMTVGGLQQSAWPTLTTADDQRIDGAAQYWCVNTIRLQIQQDYLVGVGSTPPQAGYLAAIESEVARAESHHMVVVLNDQTEGNSSGTEDLPTAGTLAFWHQLDAVYKNDPQVILDIFNEPRLQSTDQEPADCAAQDWEWWQHGNTAILNGNLGMQEIVDSVRGDGAANLIWAEGPCWAGTLAHVMKYPLTDPAHKLVYDFHHPSGAAASPHTATEWNADFGYLIDDKLAPVVDGEWTNRSSGTSTNCWADAPTAVPAYLSYLSDRGMGLVGFQLVNGFLLRSDNLDDPSIIDSRWQCGDTAIDEGAGQLLMDWFQLHNGIFAGS